MRSFVAGLCVAALLALSSSAPAGPSGSTGLVYARFNNGKPAIYNSAAVKLATNADTPVISPDGQSVVYEAIPTTRTGEPSLRIVAYKGGASHQIAANLRDLEPTAWSADGEHVAAAVGPELGINRLIISDVHSGRTRTVAQGFIRGLSWSPDGSRLVYGLTHHSYSYPGQVDLYVVSAGGGAPKAITHDHRSAYPIWGRTEIAFQRYDGRQPRNDNPKANLFTIQSNGSGLRQLTHATAPRFLTGLQPLAFSGDGKRLLAEYGGQDTSYAQTVNLVTGAARTVGSTTNLFLGMGLSRDGSTILAAKGGFDPNGPHSIVTFTYSGGPPTVVVPNAYFATWNR